MTYLAASVTGDAMNIPNIGLISPNRAEIRPIGKISDTTPIVSKLVIGAIKDTYPKCIAVSGIVNIVAPIVVARLDVIKLMTALGSFFL